MLPSWAARNWPLIYPHVQKLIEHETEQGFTPQAIFDGIQSGRWQLWVVGNADAIVLTTTYEQQAGHCIFSVNMAGGANVVGKVPEILEVLQSYARLNGCSGVEIVGRKGWEKLIRPYGYSHFYTAWFKRLE